MENHPIPQDVTGFKFKIIGSMTVKQFAYILVAGFFCVVVFAGLNKSHPILMFPLMAAFAGAGAMLAFVPIGGRPMDKMLIYFASSLPKENQYLYHKQGVTLSEFEYFKPLKIATPTQTASQKSQSDVNKIALASALRNSYFRPDDSEMQFFNNLKSTFDNSAVPAASIASALPAAAPIMAAPVAPTPAQTQPVTPLQTAQVDQGLQSSVDAQIGRLSEPQVREITPTPPTPVPTFNFKPEKQDVVTPVNKRPAPADAVAEIKKEIQDIRVEEQAQGSTQDLEARIRELEQKLAESQGQANTFQQKVLEYEKQTPVATVVTPTEEVQPKPTETVKTITPQTSLASGFPSLPDIPNIVLGIVKDPRGKVLQNILVEVVDDNETPVRAFKTNALGQFISATPLPNGTYKIYFDDPGKKHDFEAVQVEMTGSIFNPIEIISIDQREKLRRELFGGTTVKDPVA